MIFGSVCSGVEAASVAWSTLGWEAAWFCEFDKFPSAVLEHHYPNIPNLNDMTKIEERNEYHDRAIDLLVGGTPCQSFSIAGLRKGLDDDRGNLALKFCEILRNKQPRWFVWENVPGVLSSNNGRDFASILSGFRECGYGFAYRVLDAQYFGVAQRRRRVFVVGYIGDWRRAAAVLFEQDSLHRNFAPSKETGEDNTANLGKCLTARGAGGLNYDPETANFIPACYAIQGNIIDRSPNNGGNGLGFSKEKSGTLTVGDRHAVFFQSKASVLQEKFVRRLTPIECERLQGFPDNYTNIPWRGKNDAPDTPRYKSMGNSMAVPVMRWIGERIELADKLKGKS